MADPSTIKTIAAFWFVPSLLAFAAGSCSGASSDVTVKDPTDACVRALEQSPQIAEQAAKIGATTTELALFACSNAVNGLEILANKLNTGGATFHVERAAPSMAGSSQGIAGSSQ